MPQKEYQEFLHNQELAVFLLLQEVYFSLLRLFDHRNSSGDRLLSEKIFVTFYGVQLTMGIFIPFVLLVLVMIMKNREQLKTLMIAVSSIFVVIGVFAMRWNVVIGGQEISKSLSGTNTYVPIFFSQEGVLPALIIMILPFIILTVLTYILPPWKDMET